MSESNKMQRYLMVVSGPSGIGKDTVVKHLIDKYDGVEKTVSATTRTPRDGEKNGEHYYYLSVEEFKSMIEEDAFVEHAVYAKNYYGTLKNEVQKRIENKIACILVIEINGAANVKSIYPDCTTVFIEAPSMEEHERRLRGRGSESEEVMAERMRIAEKEMQMADTYDFRLINDDAQECADRLYDVLQQRLGE